ncbi:MULTISPECIES: glycosyltransferase family 4 protein [unclassified Isoptericola]|uniref:glycosyltransferase family 4 protein n=1 Tax=unclassified Isoptericola TaxID=2623355 RepID=UPI003661EB63
MPVSFNAEHGGLHDHVEEIAVSARDRDVQVVVACRPGPFASRLIAQDIPVIHVDLTDVEAACNAAREAGPWDLVHSHPFAAREFAVEFTRREEVPLIVTMHGWYLDDIAEWHESADAIIGVTGAIADRLKSVPGVAKERIHVIENRIGAAKVGRQAPGGASGPLVLSVVSRLDNDFGQTQAVIEEFIQRSTEVATDRPWHIRIAGDGSARNRVAAELGALALAPGAPDISFLGWVDALGLRRLYEDSFATISPGRAAIDAIASGIPTVLTRQIGTYALSPIGDTATLIYGTENSHVSGGSFFDFCRELAEEPQRRRDFLAYSSRTVGMRLNPQMLEFLLLSVYESVIGFGRRPQATATLPESAPEFQVTPGPTNVLVQYTGDPDGREFAFYVLHESTRIRTEWYSPQSTIEIRPDELAQVTAVQCFVKHPSGAIGQTHVKI